MMAISMGVGLFILPTFGVWVVLNYTRITELDSGAGLVAFGFAFQGHRHRAYAILGRAQPKTLKLPKHPKTLNP